MTSENLSNCSNEHVLKSLDLSVEDVGKVASAAVLAVVHGSHENTSTALFALSALSATKKFATAAHLRCRTFSP